jgi:catechol 2,3-dioxygenase-like lactoylglutathione lyase family enzyme
VFDHVTIRVSDREASRAFYELALGELGFELTSSGEHFDEWWDFSISQAGADRPQTRGLHVAFTARSREAVDAWWRAVTEAGHPDDGAPGPRPEYHSRYYGAFVRDPDGNSVEAVFHGRLRPSPNRIDHLWIRVADLRASKRFYDLLAHHAGVRWGVRQDGRVHYAAANRSFAIVDDAPVTDSLHVAFPAHDNAAVDEFHRVLTAAGYRDNGSPGERPEYHRGYYGAFVLDPDGNNIELVCHNRAD